MFKRFIVLSALALSSTGAAHADTLGGFFSAFGVDTFTPSSISFGTAQVAGTIGGTFASYLTDGNAITFLSGTLPYHNGVNTPPLSVYPSGIVPIFSTTENGTTFTFNMSQYDAGYGTGTGCTQGSSCLNITGMGFFTATGSLAGTSGPSTFTFSSQYVDDQPLATVTTFAASTAAMPSAVPEPSTLALFSTGMVGIAGIMRRKLFA